MGYSKIVSVIKIIIFLSNFCLILCDYEDYTYCPEVNKSYKFHITPLVWYNAVRKCRSENATLAMPKNSAEALVLKNIFAGYSAARLTAMGVPWADYMYLGFHDAFLEGEFITVLDERPVSKMYNKWEPNQPDDFLWAEDCGTLHRNGGLNDFSCVITLVFICQKEPKTTSVERTNKKSSNNDNAYYYSFNENMRYHLHTKPQTWSEAVSICNEEESKIAFMNTVNAGMIFNNAVQFLSQDNQNLEMSLVHWPNQKHTYQGQYAVIKEDLDEKTVKTQYTQQNGNAENFVPRIRNRILFFNQPTLKAIFFCESDLLINEFSGLIDLRMSIIDEE